MKFFKKKTFSLGVGEVPQGTIKLPQVRAQVPPKSIHFEFFFATITT
jgi:hypothetical protein